MSAYFCCVCLERVGAEHTHVVTDVTEEVVDKRGYFDGRYWFGHSVHPHNIERR